MPTRLTRAIDEGLLKVATTHILHIPYRILLNGHVHRTQSDSEADLWHAHNDNDGLGQTVRPRKHGAEIAATAQLQPSYSLQLALT